MLAKVLSAAIVGLDAELVNVEVDIVKGQPYFALVGLPDAAVRESRDRVYVPVRPQMPATTPKPLRSFSFHTFRYAPNSPVTFILISSLIWIGTSPRSTLFISL